MIHEQVILTSEKGEATLTSYVHDDDPKLKMPKRIAVIVCPGGAYRNLSPREAEPIASQLFGRGINAFVLRYTLGKSGASDHAPLIELAKAIKYIRQSSEKYNIRKDRVFVMGFSAGGHLAASSGVLWNCDQIRKALDFEKGVDQIAINRPDGMILCYPVISGGNYAHKNSFANLCGKDDPAQEEKNVFSLELHVDSSTPPAFIWHTATDSCVPVQNSLLFTQALIDNGVSVEFHMFPYGRHGLALANEETWSQNPDRLVPHADIWFELAMRWISDFDELPSN